MDGFFRDLRYTVRNMGRSPGFARTTGMRVLIGRDIDWSDVAGQRRVAVVNEEMARHFFGDLNVIGRRYSHGTAYNAANDYEIIGVVSNAKYTQVRGDFPRTAYVPFTADRGVLRGLYFHVRAAGDPLVLAPAARRVIQQIDPSVAVVELDAMSNQIANSLWQERLFARLTTVFSALALACIGLYGTISYGVGRRRSEIAVRMALGARYSQVLWMVLRQALVLAVGGVIVGIPLSLCVGRQVRVVDAVRAHGPATH